MTQQPETKHDRFMRLMTKRLGKALDDIRLVSQLATPNYENTPEEASEVVRLLDVSVRKVAEAFHVPFKSAMGSPKTPKTPLPALVAGPINEVDIAKAIEHIVCGKHQEALQLLRDALNQEPRS